MSGSGRVLSNMSEIIVSVITTAYNHENTY